MQELRERAAAAEFNSSAARRQLEALTDMMRWQGSASSVPGAGAVYQLPLPPAQPGLPAGSSGALGGGAGAWGGGSAAPAGHWGAVRQARRAGSLGGPLPVYETVTALSLQDSR